jgi:hypothetical protein
MFTTAWGGLFVPGVEIGTRVRLQLPVHVLDADKVCVSGAVASSAVHAAATSPPLLYADFGDVTVQEPSPEVHAPTVARTYAILGLGPARSANGAYNSPVLEVLRVGNSPIAFSISQLDGVVLLTLGVRAWPCLDFCWSTMEVAEHGARYRVPLKTTRALPTAHMSTTASLASRRGEAPIIDGGGAWKSLDLALGNWLTQIPAEEPTLPASANRAALYTTAGDSATLQLTTNTSCVVGVPAGLYKTVVLLSGHSRASQYAPTAVQLGLSAGLTASSTFAVDLTLNRFGISAGL